MTATKKAKLSASLEDYLEAIYNLSGESNFTRSRDIAERLGVSRASVTGALRLLQKKGLCNYKPYEYISLTESGRASAKEVVKKHEILTSFFTDVLSVRPGIAQESACKAEHALGPEIIAKLLSFIEFVSSDSDNGNNFLEEFQKFCNKKGKRTFRTAKKR